MMNVVVTGGNKGIGLAIVKNLVEERSDCFVFLASRSLERGEKALSTINANAKSRVFVLQLDVDDKQSILAAAATVESYLKEKKESLNVLVNNAGHTASLIETLRTNLYGVHDVTVAFLPLLLLPSSSSSKQNVKPRIVNISSGAAPSFTSKCSRELQASFLVNRNTTWEEIDKFAKKIIDISSSSSGKEVADINKELEALGINEKIDASLGPQAVAAGMTYEKQSLFGYGLSKSLLNTYTLSLAHQHPNILINSCSPGFIETDIIVPWLIATGKTPAELGMKTPVEGAKCPLHLCIGDISHSGWYVGSDCLRSPMDKYRSPGTDAFLPTADDLEFIITK